MGFPTSPSNPPSYSTPTCHVHAPAPGFDHTHTVILLHGRDSAAAEFASEFFESEASPGAYESRILPALFPSIRWVFPAAPLLYSDRFGTELTQWFDMWAVEEPGHMREMQREGLQRSVAQILDVVRSEEALLPRGRIFLGGISQGFATAVAAYLAEGRGGLAGLIGLCSWMPFADDTDTLAAIQGLCLSEGSTTAMHASPATLTGTPIFLSHSSDDEVVPVQQGRRLNQVLSTLGFQVDWHEYADGGHWVNEPQGVDHMCVFLRRHMDTSRSL